MTQSGGTTTTTASYGSLAESVNGTLSYLLSDGLGSISEAVSTAGQVTATQLYAPYGGVRYQSGTLPTDKGYTGQRSDAATSGLDYYGARYYDPVAGQFTSADTTLAGGLNRYAYVGGDPETRTDPSGHLYAPPREYSRSLAMQQSQSEPYFSYGNLGEFIAGLPQFLFGVDTLRQAFHTIFQDPHASAGDKWKAAGVAGVTVLSDVLTIGSLVGGQPEVGADVRSFDEGLLATTEATNDAKAAVTATTNDVTEIATEAGGDRYVQFAHGTSLEYAQDITTGGLDASKAHAATTGGIWAKPGSFFTFNETEYGQSAVQNAYEQGFTQSSNPVVLMGRLPQSVFDELVAGGGVEVRLPPNFEIPETVFGPDTFDQLNKFMNWFNIINPY